MPKISGLLRRSDVWLGAALLLLLAPFVSGGIHFEMLHDRETMVSANIGASSLNPPQTHATAQVTFSSAILDSEPSTIDGVFDFFLDNNNEQFTNAFFAIDSRSQCELAAPEFQIATASTTAVLISRPGSPLTAYKREVRCRWLIAPEHSGTAPFIATVTLQRSPAEQRFLERCSADSSSFIYERCLGTLNGNPTIQASVSGIISVQQEPFSFERIATILGVCTGVLTLFAAFTAKPPITPVK